MKRLVWTVMDRPKGTLVLLFLLTLVFGIQFPKIHVDTDPENMLEKTQPDRLLYKRAKQEFGIHDMIVLGITDKKGVFRPETLASFKHIVDGILNIKGVITHDVLSLTTTNDVKSKNSRLEVRPVMEAVPEDIGEAQSIQKAIGRNPLLVDKLSSRDGKGLAVYVPIQRKDEAHQVGTEIEKIARRELKDGQSYHLAGLPVAEDTFGVEMFEQMAILAPLTGMVIFLLLWLLFRSVVFVLPAMIIAMFSVIWGMGLMIGMGFSVHIMSSMIPVFLMPIAVLDCVHILSEFYDRYPKIKNRYETLRQVMGELFTPMLYTSLTSAIGFGSLMFADIPPVQVFGGFVAFGILVAWLLTITLIPASIMLMKETWLKKSIRVPEKSILSRLLPPLGRSTLAKYKLVGVLALCVFIIGGTGLFQIVVNDNPVKWFAKGHPMRVADQVMNRLFGGTYMAYLIVEGRNPDDVKSPDVMRYVVKLQRELERDEAVGKTSSVADIVGQVATVLHDGDDVYRKIPSDSKELAQYLFLFQMSGDPGDLDNFVDYDYRLANIWVQMKRGENKDMDRVAKSIAAFMAKNPPPQDITVRWSGLTYINKIWQDLMVVGMRNAVMTGFAAVFLLMLLLFRSFWLGLISMVPLTFSIVISYGLVGWTGKNYDMPIAVCSSLALGLSIDFAIHFIQRFRSRFARDQQLDATNRYMFAEPGRAIARNALVIILGFLPMVLASLTPYKTVGVFFALLMTLTAVATLTLLPGFLRVWITAKKMVSKKVALS